MPARISMFFLLLVPIGTAFRFRRKRFQRRSKEEDVIEAAPLLPTTSTPSPLAFPSVLASKFIMTRYLGKGSFGMSFLVTKNATSRQMVMKLLYREIDREKKIYEYLTLGKAKQTTRDTDDILKAANECDVSGFIHEQGKTMNHPGAQRVMNCFGHNIPVVDGQVVNRTDRADSEPLYLLLENCGDKDLTKFMADKASQNQLTLHLVKNLFKQIMEGLSYLASLAVPYIHHDLKPDNIVVKTQNDHTYSIHLIDFGAATKVDIRRLCIWTPSTAAWAPKEYATYNFRRCSGAKQNFEWCGDANTSNKCPSAFDVYSAGCILPQLITGLELHYRFWNDEKKELNHDAISKTMQPQPLANYIVSAWQAGYWPVTDAARQFNEVNALSELLNGMLQPEAKSRWSATAVLESSWLKLVKTNDDYDYQKELRVVAGVSKEKAKLPSAKVSQVPKEPFLTCSCNTPYIGTTSARLPFVFCGKFFWDFQGMRKRFRGPDACGGCLDRLESQRACKLEFDKIALQGRIMVNLAKSTPGDSVAEFFL